MDRDFVYGLTPETYNLPAATTLVIGVLPGQNALTLKYISGGSLSILGASTGIVGSSFIVGGLYQMATGEVLNLDSSGAVMLYAVGSTCVFSVLRGRSPGF